MVSGPSKFVHTLHIPQEKPDALTEHFIEQNENSEILFEHCRRSEMQIICSGCNLCLYFLNYGILFGVYGYGLYLGTTDKGVGACADIATWLTVWCTFAVAMGGYVLLLYFFRCLLIMTWRYPVGSLGDGKALIKIKSSGVYHTCMVADSKWAQKLQAAKLSRMCPYFFLCAIALWQPAGLSFTGYWLIDAYVNVQLVGNYGDCSNVGSWTFGIWAFSSVICSLIGILYLVIVLVLGFMVCTSGIRSTKDAVFELLAGPVLSYGDGT